MTRFFKLLWLPLVCVIELYAPAARGAELDDAAAAAARTQALKVYKDQVAPFMANYCTACHSGNKQKGGVTFQSVLKNPDSPSFLLLWKRAATQINTHEMPPEGEKQPTDKERKAVTEWVAGIKRLSRKDPGVFVIRRLNRVEYGNTLRDLFGVDPQIARELPDEVFGAGFTNSLSPTLMDQYLAVANDVLSRVVASPGSPPTAMQQKLFGPDLAPGADRKAAARKVARSIARQAYRRPASEGEVDVLVRVYALAADQGKSHAESLRLMVKAVLVSPQFLFITPGPAAQSPTGGGDIVPLDDYQLASRLSYLLWATMPDAELSALADAGKLRDPKVLAAQAKRLIADPRSRAFFDGFGAQWLGVDKLAGKAFDTEKFPQMTAALRSAMYDEARLMFESILRDNKSLGSFIESDYTFLNGTLAPLYGMQAKVRGPEMRKVTLTDANRGGILTMPGVLATSSFPNRTSAVNRGVWVLEQVLGEHVPPPPANVPPLEKQDKKKVATLTLRQRTELHRVNPACANCHKVLDPIGFGLENFDAIGRWRDRDESGGPIDATGELPGNRHFKTPAELKRIIAGRKADFSRNLTSKMMAYALCRQLEGYDDVVIDQLADTIAGDGYRMQTLVVGVVTSYPFMHRRVNIQQEASRAK
ncbi:DUF1592 domain-containing protein [Humisphaera borealis]|uniref:DUF1592 domain-containing protein n=1 Tax=Humisphaera borealis TaxID=2807512 RepID=A0A7M2X0R6_9BACT|nr:DUF1592 domain-containing protein [Humisphaera borealis]QOV91336.1 DUF1592 domain-containing protein [Humisphaera borealis]